MIAWRSTVIAGKHFNRRVHTRGHGGRVPVSDCPLVPVVCTVILPRERAVGVVGHRKWPSGKGGERTEGREDVRRFESPAGDDDQPIRLPRVGSEYCGVQVY